MRPKNIRLHCGLPLQPPGSAQSWRRLLRPYPPGRQGDPSRVSNIPLLFNLALIDLPRRLNEVPNIKHGLYADDITIWTASASLGDLQDSLQQATDIVNEYAQECGLSCAPQKSELLLVRRKGTANDCNDIEIQLDGHTIRPCKHLKILGLTIQADTKNTILVNHLKHSAEQVTHMIRRISNRQRGMKEQDTVRLVQAFVLSRITYTAPYTVLSKSEIEKTDVIIRKAYKQALGLPMSTSTARLLNLGLHNTAAELIEAHLAGHKLRLGLSPAGRRLLETYKWEAQGRQQPQLLPPEVRANIYVPNLPKNMHPDHHAGRRKARVQALDKMYSKDSKTVYTDAAPYDRHRGAMAAVVTSRGQPLTGLTLKTYSIQEAEEVAIALAITQTAALTVITDCQAACRSYAAGTVAPTALHLLSKTPPSRTVTIVWTPAHSALPGNDTAHALARALTNRTTEEEHYPTPIVTYQEITQYYRLGRRTFPLTQPNLTKQQESTLRRLQTNTFPHPVRLNRLFPTQYSQKCQFCGKLGTLYHIIWECDQNPDLPPIPNPSHEQWESVLSGARLVDQLTLVDRAACAGTTNGLPD